MTWPKAAVYWYATCAVLVSAIYLPYPLLTYYCYHLIYYRYWDVWTVVVAAYMTWVWIFDADTCDRGSERYRSSWIRSLSLWKINAKYFPVSLQKTSAFSLDPKKNYLFCTTPHGVMTLGAFFAFATDALNCQKLFPQIRKFTLFAMGPLYKIPVIREIFMFHGLASVTKKSIEYAVNNPQGGNAGVLVIGGLRELLMSTPNQYRLYIKKRKGFVRLALEHGISLVPVFSFGENDLFHLYPKKMGTIFRSIQFRLLDLTGLPFMVGWAYGIIPFAKPVNVVVGPPLDLPKITKPTQQDIDHYHRIFVEKVEQLFEENKRKYVEDPNVKLELH